MWQCNKDKTKKKHLTTPVSVTNTDYRARCVFGLKHYITYNKRIFLLNHWKFNVCVTMTLKQFVIVYKDLC